MSRLKGYLPVTAWTMERCPCCDKAIAVLPATDGTEMRLLLADPDARWLIRARHPAYSSRLQPILETLPHGRVRLEIEDEAAGIVYSSSLVSSSPL